MLLEIAHLTVRYEKAVLINDLNLCVDTGELVSLVGPNGAGKSTTLRAISGLVAWEKEIKRRSTAGDIFLEGTVTFNGDRIDRIPAHEIVRRGLVLCPETEKAFPGDDGAGKSDGGGLSPERQEEKPGDTG